MRPLRGSRALLGLVVAACGGRAAPKETLEPPTSAAPPPAAADPACPPAGDAVDLVDGAFRCRELPFTVRFPPATGVTRQDQGSGWNGGSFFFGQPDGHHVKVGIIAGPQRAAMSGVQVDRMFESALAAVVPGGALKSIEPPALAGAIVSRGAEITAPDGRIAIVYTYYANDWLVSVVAAAKDGERPDGPIGKAFLTSLQLRPLPTGRVKLALVDGATIEIPASSWEAPVSVPDPAARFARWYVVPGRGAFFGVRAVDAGDLCGRIQQATPAELRTLIDTTFLAEDMPSTAYRPTARGVSFESVRTDLAMASSVVCVGPLVVQLMSFDTEPSMPRAIVEELAPTVAGPS